MGFTMLRFRARQARAELAAPAAACAPPLSRLPSPLMHDACLAAPPNFCPRSSTWTSGASACSSMVCCVRAQFAAPTSPSDLQLLAGSLRLPGTGQGLLGCRWRLQPGHLCSLLGSPVLARAAAQEWAADAPVYARFFAGCQSAGLLLQPPSSSPQLFLLGHL